MICIEIIISIFISPIIYCQQTAISAVVSELISIIYLTTETVVIVSTIVSVSATAIFNCILIISTIVSIIVADLFCIYSRYI